MPKSLNHLALVAALVFATAAAAQSDKPSVKKPSAPPAVLSQEEGWNTQWALLFGLNDFLVTGAFLSSTAAGTISAEYFMSEDTGLRVGGSLRRSSSPITVTKVVSTSGGQSVTTYQFDDGGGDLHAVALSADYLKRLSGYSVAPYVGAGLSVGWAWNRWAYVDEVSQPYQATEFIENTSGINLGVRGILGAEWRLHPSFSLYAEYAASLTLINSTMYNRRVITESTPPGAEPATSQTTTAFTNTQYLLLNTQLAQGAQLGLAVFF